MTAKCYRTTSYFKQRKISQVLSELFDYVETMWLASSVWSPSTLWVYQQDNRTNNDIARRSHVPFYMMVERLFQGGADGDAAAPPALRRQSASPNQHALRCRQQAPEGAVNEVRRRQLADVTLLAGCRPLSVGLFGRCTIWRELSSDYHVHIYILYYVYTVDVREENQPGNVFPGK